MSEYNFEEERGGRDFDFEPFDRAEYYEPSESQINDWNIHNDHQDGNEEPIEDFAPCWHPTCLLEVCNISEHFVLTDEDLDRMFAPDVPFDGTLI